MDTFKMWMLSLCGATAITALFRILLSNSSLNKALNIFFTLFVLFYTVAPVQILFKDNFFDKTSINLSTEYNEIYKNGYEQIIELSIEKVCEELEVELLSCDITSNMNDDGSLVVESIEIHIKDSNQDKYIKNELKKQLGYEVIVK